MYKRKAVESAQTAADLKLHLDKYHAQLKEVQVAVSEKTSTLQQQSFKFKRIQVIAVLCLITVSVIYSALKSVICTVVVRMKYVQLFV